MDVARKLSPKSNHVGDSSTDTGQSAVSTAEVCVAGVGKPHDLRGSSREIHERGHSSTGNSENVSPSAELVARSGSQMRGNVGSSVSVWSAITNRACASLQIRSSCGGSDCGLKGNMRARWNAAWRRALTIDPVRCLHERVFGCHRASTFLSSMRSIWLLGVCYHFSDAEEHASSIEIYKQFEADFQSRIWVTYRKGFQSISGTKLTTDIGWGCMIRSAQMLLAQALICHHLGRRWQRSDVGAATHSSLRWYLEILQCFGDIPTCSFSIHNIVKSGGPYGLVAGSWMGPYAMCRSLEALLGSYRKSSLTCNSKPGFSMAIHVVSGEAEGERGGAPCICIDAVSEICSNWGEALGETCALMLLIPLVLGLNKLNPRYLPLLAETFTFPQSLGMLGGKPGASTYLVGIQGDQVIYLDPHHAQQVCLISPDNPKVDTSTYHCSNVKRMPLTAIDPSLALGFYCRNQEDFRDLCERVMDLEKKGDGAPMFTIVQSKDKHQLVKDNYATMCSRSVSNRDMKTSEEGWQLL